MLPLKKGSGSLRRICFYSGKSEQGESMKNQKGAVLFIAVFVVASFMFAGCASYTPPQTYSFVNTREYDKTFDEVWGKVVQWFALSGNPVKNMDKASGFIATDYNLAIDNEAVCDCGKGGIGFGQSITLKEKMGNFNLLVQKLSDSKTKLTITAKFYSIYENRQASYSAYSSATITTDKHECNSRGVLETEILDYVQK